MPFIDDVFYRLPPYEVHATFAASEVAERVDWGLELLGVPEAWKSSRGAGIKVAVLDSGVDFRHPDLQSVIEDVADFTRMNGDGMDRLGHGTHCAGVIAAPQNGVGVVGVAPECRLLCGKVLADNGSGSNRNIAAGIQWAMDRGADVISLSLGGPISDSYLAQAVRMAALAGKLLICAAGNDGVPNSVNYPAKYRETLAVSAIGKNKQLAPYSSRGPEVDVAAPGSEILSTIPNGRYATMSGTSMATPFAAGVVALAIAKHRMAGSTTPISGIDQLREHLQRTSTDVGAIGRDSDYGWGLINPRDLVGPQPAPVPDRPPPASGMKAIRIGPQLVWVDKNVPVDVLE